jgi:hypothetical protein
VCSANCNLEINKFQLIDEDRKEFDKLVMAINNLKLRPDTIHTPDGAWCSSCCYLDVKVSYPHPPEPIVQISHILLPIIGFSLSAISKKTDNLKETVCKIEATYLKLLFDMLLLRRMPATFWQ